jgi:hypothetical protein
MSIESVQIIDFHQHIIATAKVKYNGEYYSSFVNIDRIHINVLMELIKSFTLKLP